MGIKHHLRYTFNQVISMDKIMDQLDISGLSINTRIGIHAWEQRISQRLLIDIGILTDFSTCKNDLANTIDYDKVCQCVTTALESNAYTLIETVAENVAQLIKDEFKVSQLTVRVSKPNAIKNAGNISVSISR